VKEIFLSNQVLTKDGQEIGKISKQWSGLVKEYFTDADNFGVQFPKDLDVKVKASLLGAVFLIVSLIVTLLCGSFVVGRQQGSHAVLKVLNCEIGFPDLEKVLNWAKMFIKYGKSMKLPNSAICSFKFVRHR